MGSLVKPAFLLAATAVGVASIWSASVSDPGAWVLALAGIAGAGFIGRPKSKPSLEDEE
jgi:MYXO-CTERM domain-containing protein